MANKKKFNVNTWTKTSGKGKTISWTTQSSAIAYLKDTLRHMEEGKTTKLEVFYAEEPMVNN